jgi:hypothetical protein
MLVVSFAVFFGGSYALNHFRSWWCLELSRQVCTLHKLWTWRFRPVNQLNPRPTSHLIQREQLHPSWPSRSLRGAVAVHAALYSSGEAVREVALLPTWKEDKDEIGELARRGRSYLGLCNGPTKWEHQSKTDLAGSFGLVLLGPPLSAIMHLEMCD